MQNSRSRCVVDPKKDMGMKTPREIEIPTIQNPKVSVTVHT
jgi:hypothetical protein